MQTERCGTIGIAAGATLLMACGGDGHETTATRGTTATDQRLALSCPLKRAIRHADARDDVDVVSNTASARPAHSPSVDLARVTLRRGEDGVLCVTFRTAGPVRRGSTFSLATHRETGTPSRFDEDRYEVRLTPDGEVNVSRPHGEPRHPVRATVIRRGAKLQVAMQTLLVAGESFGWRAELEYLPRFPLGGIYSDSVPDDTRWLPFPGKG